VLQGGGIEGLDLRPDHTFFRDKMPILNGVWINGGPPLQRQSGTWSAETSGSRLLTLRVDGGIQEVYTFTYTPAPVLNGMWLPGYEPTATLVLTPYTTTLPATPNYTFKHAGSWCTGDADCVTEQGDQTWTATGNGNPTCDANAHTCSLQSIGTSAPWCNANHTADDEEANFNGFGGYDCADANARAQCNSLGGRWCQGFVDNQVLLCACGNDGDAGAADAGSP
jgi:hypothetical protein